jgi:hypothetical protein
MGIFPQFRRHQRREEGWGRRKGGRGGRPWRSPEPPLLLPALGASSRSHPGLPFVEEEGAGGGGRLDLAVPEPSTCRGRRGSLEPPAHGPRRQDREHTAASLVCFNGCTKTEVADRIHITGSIASPYHATKLLPFFDHDRPSTSFSTCSMKCLDVAAVLNSRHVPQRQDRCTDNRPGREDQMSCSATYARPHLLHRRPLHHRRRACSDLLIDACTSASGHRGEATFLAPQLKPSL